MCSALEDLKQEGIQQGIQQGIQEGMIVGTIKTSKKFNLNWEDVIQNIIEEYSLSKEEAEKYMKMYW